jgi:hypothetical protein
VNAGPPTEGVHFDARVIGEGEATGGAGEGARLLSGVGGVGVVGLVGFEDESEFSGCDDFEPGAGEEAAKLADLPGIVRGEQKTWHASKFRTRTGGGQARSSGVRYPSLHAKEH